MPLDLSIIIVNWNARGWLEPCLASIQDSTDGIEVEIVVVDNGSTDGSQELAATWAERCHWIKNSDNRGFAAANNQGIAAARGERLMLLNPDTELGQGAAAALLRHLDAHPNVGVVAPLLEDGDGALQPSCTPFPTVWNEALRLLHVPGRAARAYRMAEWSGSRPRAVDVVQGACMVVRREVIEKVGLLDERFFMYSEEVDFCRRVRSAGYGVDWLPTARVVHHGGRSTTLVPERMFLELHRSKVLYVRKHSGRALGVAYKLVLFLASALRIALLPLARLELGEARGRHRELGRRYLSLIRALPGL